MVRLADYDEGTIEAAFWLQEHIRKNGIDAVRFMETAEAQVRDQGPDTVADKISSEIQKL
jgi:hypothetical protein